MNDVLGNYGKRFKEKDMKELYEFWRKSAMLGPVTFYGDDVNKWRAYIKFYESYEKLDNEEEYLKSVYITKAEEKYKVEISELYEDEVVEVKYGDFEELKKIILNCYDEVKGEMKD